MRAAPAEPRWLAAAAALLADGPLVALVRHAEREVLAGRGDGASLTPSGAAAARSLATALPGSLGSLRASALRRGIETAAAIAAVRPGASIVVTRVLGGPGPFVDEPEPAWAAFERLGKHELIRRLLLAPAGLAGFRPVEPAARAFVDALCEPAVGEAAIHLAISHDLIIALLLGVLGGAPIDDDRWPGFLDGVILQRRGDDLVWWYDGAIHRLTWAWARGGGLVGAPG